MGFQVTKNAAVLEWKQVMIEAMHDAKQELCAAEGQTRLQVRISVCRMEESAATCSYPRLAWRLFAECFVLCHMHATFVLQWRSSMLLAL